MGDPAVGGRNGLRPLRSTEADEPLGQRVDGGKSRGRELLHLEQRLTQRLAGDGKLWGDLLEPELLALQGSPPVGVGLVFGARQRETQADYA